MMILNEIYFPCEVGIRVCKTPIVGSTPSRASNTFPFKSIICGQLSVTPRHPISPFSALWTGPGPDQLTPSLNLRPEVSL